MKLRLTAFFVCFSCLVTLPAAAANHALDEAKTLAAKATIEYDVGHFEQALDLYTQAYERYPKPGLLFDIAQCHKLLGHYERALFFYRGYLRGKPDVPNRTLVEKLIADSQQQLDAQMAQQAEAAKSAAPAEAAGSSNAAASGVTSAQAPAPEAPIAARPHGNPSPVLRIAGLATAGVGLALLGTAVYEGMRATSLSNSVSKVSTWTTQAQSDYDAGKSAATAADVLYVAGGVALAAGIALTWVGWPKTRAVAAGVAPLPGGASASLIARF